MHHIVIMFSGFHTEYIQKSILSWEDFCLSQTHFLLSLGQWNTVSLELGFLFLMLVEVFGS